MRACGLSFAARLRFCGVDVPAPQRHLTPAAQMVILARGAKAEGLSFEDFWLRAVRPNQPVVTITTPREKVPPGCVRWPSDSLDGRFWRTATEGTKDGWRRAYENLPPTPQERALVQLAPYLARVGTLGELVVA